ncbi:MAG: hypothetical protein GY817_05880 [bacterium]|nr:hypothetical protein [bacterium]
MKKIFSMFFILFSVGFLFSEVYITPAKPIFFEVEPEDSYISDKFILSEDNLNVVIRDKYSDQDLVKFFEIENKGKEIYYKFNLPKRMKREIAFTVSFSKQNSFFSEVYTIPIYIRKKSLKPNINNIKFKNINVFKKGDRFYLELILKNRGRIHLRPKIRIINGSGQVIRFFDKKPIYPKEERKFQSYLSGLNFDTSAVKLEIVMEDQKMLKKIKVKL